MKFRVYRSLDRSVQIFGIRGRYLYIMTAGAVVSVLISLVIGSAASGLVGLLCFLVLFFTCAIGVLLLQARLPEKELFLKIGMMKCPDVIRVKPERIFRQWK